MVESTVISSGPSEYILEHLLVTSPSENFHVRIPLFTYPLVGDNTRWFLLWKFFFSRQWWSLSPFLVLYNSSQILSSSFLLPSILYVENWDPFMKCYLSALQSCLSSQKGISSLTFALNSSSSSSSFFRGFFRLGYGKEVK